MPTLAELQTIVLDYPCTGAFGESACNCPSSPCVAFNDPNTRSNDYWSATSFVLNPGNAWIVSFRIGGVYATGVGTEGLVSFYVRAVRGGL